MSGTEKLMILDGGMGRHLAKKYELPIWNLVNNKHYIWSGWGIIESKYHNSVINAHLDYLYAGSHVITTCNYCISPGYMEPIGWIDKLDDFTRVAVNLAKKAKELHGKSNILIAGCVPPLGRSYVPNVYNEKDSLKYYNTIITSLYKNGINIFLAETMSGIKEVNYVLQSIQSVIKNKDPKCIETWISLTLNVDGHLRTNETINDAIKSFASYIDSTNITHIGFNCCTPESIDIAFKSLNKNSKNILNKNNIKFILYPNVFIDISTQHKTEQKHKVTKTKIRDDLPKQQMYQKYIKKWIHNWDNIGIIGGCCEINDEYIKYFVNNIKKDYPNILFDSEWSVINYRTFFIIIIAVLIYCYLIIYNS